MLVQYLFGRTIGALRNSRPSAFILSWIHVLRDFVEFVASRIATLLSLSSNHRSMSSTAASAAARRAFSPSGLLMSKNLASGCGLSLRRYLPTLKISAFTDVHLRYRLTRRRQ